MAVSSIRAGAFALVAWAASVHGGTAAGTLEYRGGYSVLGNMLGVAGLAAGDIDGDGHADIVVAGTTLTFGGPGLFSVLRADATAPSGYRQVAFSEPYDAQLTTLALIDRNGDGAEDIVAGLGDGTVQVFERTLLFEGPTTTVTGAVNQILMADADGDGVDDLVVLGPDVITLLDPATLENRGSVGYGVAEMAVGDVDGDGHPEIVLNTGKVIRLSRSGQALTSQLLWAYPAGDFGVHVALADIDGDGLPELIAESDWDYLTAFDLDTQTPKWQINQLGDLDAMSLADVSGDGIPEAIIGSGQWGNETAIDLTTRTVLWSVPNPDPGTGRVLVADVDDDGLPELVWTGGYDSTGEDNLFVYSLSSLTEKWHTLHVDGPFDAIAVAPVNVNVQVPHVAFASFRSQSGYADGIVWQWNASTLAPLTATMPDTFDAFAWTGIHALGYSGSASSATPPLLVGTDRLYDGAIFSLDWSTGARQSAHYYDSGSPMYTLLSVDLDGDGNAETIAGDFGADTGSPGIYVFILDPTSGAEIWRSISLAPTFGGVEGLASGDFDGDGIQDIAALVNQGGDDCAYFQFTGAAHVQWQSSGCTYSAITTFDVDGVGRVDVIAGDQSGHVRVIDPRTHGVIHAIDIGSGPVAALRVFRDPATSRLRVAALIDERLKIVDLDSGQLVVAAPHRISDTRALEVVDADGDNRMDVFVGGETAFRVYRLPNDAILANGFD